MRRPDRGLAVLLAMLLLAAMSAVAADDKEAARDADGYVREHPWQAVGIAAGVGLLLGILISRR